MANRDDDEIDSVTVSSSNGSQLPSSHNFYPDPNAFHIDQSVVQVKQSKTNFLMQQQQQQQQQQNNNHNNSNNIPTNSAVPVISNNNTNNNSNTFPKSPNSVSRVPSASPHSQKDFNSNNNANAGNQNPSNIYSHDDDMQTLTDHNGTTHSEHQKRHQTSCLENASRPLRTYGAYGIALVVTAINLLFFLCLSVLLVMVSVDILISLIIQCALPPDAVFAFAGAALICVVFPWIAVWISTVADYSRWPAKFFLLHYHLRIFFNVQEPFRPITDISLEADKILGAVNRQIHEIDKDKERDDPAIAVRSRIQVLISLVPIVVWFIALLIGVLVGKQHNYGTVFFLVTGFLFVIFITVFEYDVAPVASAKTSVLAFRSSEASSLRHILLHHRKFDLGLVGIASAIATSLIVFFKDPNAVGGGLESFLLSIVVLVVSFCAVLSLRWKVKLSVDKRELERRERHLLQHQDGGDYNINRGSVSVALGSGNPTYSQLSNNPYQGGGGVMSRSILQSNQGQYNSTPLGLSAKTKGGSENQPLLSRKEKEYDNNNNNSSKQSSSTTTPYGSKAGIPLSPNRVRDPERQENSPGAIAALANFLPHNGSKREDDGESMCSDLHRKGESNCNNGNDQDSSTQNCFKLCKQEMLAPGFFQKHIDFVLLATEIVLLFAASLCITIDTPSPKESWSVWLGFIFCTLCTVGLWYMQIRLQNDDVETDRVEEAKKRACHKAQAYLANEIARNKFDDDETRLVKTYEPARVPPDAVYRISYFVVAFVAVIVVFVAIFNAHRDSAAVRAGVNATFDDPLFYKNINNNNNNNINRLQHSVMSGYWSTIFPSYAICATLFPGNFSIVDVAALASVSQMDDKRTQLEVFFPSLPAAHPNNETINERVDWAENKGVRVGKSFITLDYYSVRFPARKVTVIVSRGAFSKLEALQQLYVLSDSVALELAIMLLPLPFGDRLLAAMIRIVAVCKFGMYALPDYAVERAQNALAAHPDENVLLVGFSLGGFVTNIAASKIADDRVHSATISPIGCGFQSLRFGFSDNDGDRYCTSVSAQDDVLAKFDQTMGLQQKIVSNEECTLANSFCHDSGLMLDSLSKQCRDPLRRRAIVDEE